MRIAVCTLLLALSTTARADDKAVKWEYAELSYRTTYGRPAGTGIDGKEVPAVPPSVSLKWMTGAEEATFKGWEELGERLKVRMKAEGSMSSKRLQVLNALGAEGWELVTLHAATQGMNTTLLFKRRAK